MALRSPVEFKCAHKINCVHAHLMNKIADVAMKEKASSLSALAVSCFKKVNVKL